MSIRRSTPRSVVAAGLSLACAVAVVAATASDASADPPALDRDACATTLARASLWPGTMSAGGIDVRLASDGFDGHLSRLPACQPTP